MSDKPKIVRVAEGLMIFAKYPNTDYAIAAEHDVIYAGPGGEDLISEEDQKTLKDLGWHWASDVDSWATFV